MDILLRLYRTLNLLSMDVAVGSVISALCFSRLFELKFDPFSMAALGLSVWVIYTVDRLLDVRNLKVLATTDRHKFHQRYKSQLWISVFLVTVVGSVLILFLHQSVLLAGIVLSIFIVGYLAIQKYLRMKEMVVAILYTAGILLPSLSVFTDSVTFAQSLLIAQFFIVALINLLLFSWFEHVDDKDGGSSSFVMKYGKHVTICLVFVLIVSSCTVSAWLVIQNTLALASGSFLLMTLILLILALFPAYFSINARYRLWGDAVFYLPLFGLIE